MRQFITIVEAALAATSGSFVLAPFLRPKNYQITASLKDVAQWRAKILAGNSMSDEMKVGDFDDVGYVMVSLADNTIVPIARSDEHHTGFDLLSKLCRKTGNCDDYIPVFAIGNNYVYSDDDVKLMFVAVKKFLSYGGDPNLRLFGANSLTGKVTTLGEFVKNGGSVAVAPGELNPAGRAVIAAFQQFSNTVVEAMQSDQKSKTGKAFAEAAKLVQLVSVELFGCEAMAKDTKGKLGALAKDDLQGLQEVIFGFDGLKNKIHNSLRALERRRQQGKKPEWDDSYAERSWGDIPLAIDMLGRI